MSFTKKLITVQVSLATGVFDGGGNTATISGLRMSCKIAKAGGPSMGLLDLAIFGLPLTMANQLTTLGTQINATGRNSIIVMAGDEESGMAKIFQGWIDVAFLDPAAMPQVPFRVTGHAGSLESVIPAASTSVDGPADVAILMSTLAATMGLSFENNNVSAKLASAHFSGSARTQAKEIAEAAGIEWLIDNGTLAIWNPGQARQGDATMISSDTGMVGFPAFNSAGIVVKTLFNKTLMPGGHINVQSILTPACGNWIIVNLDYDLESVVPNGKWFTGITAIKGGVGDVS